MISRRFAPLLASLLSFSLAAFCATPALAYQDSLLTIMVDKPIAVLVDGEVLEFIENTTRVEVHGISPGRHAVEFRNFFGKLKDQGTVEVPDGPGAIVRARWSGGVFDVYETLVQNAPPVVVVHEVPADQTVSVHIDGGGLGLGGSVMVTDSSGGSTTVHTEVGGLGLSGSVTVTESHSGGLVYDEDVVQVQEALPATRLVTFRTTDEEWANVYIDGQNVWELRAMDKEHTITLSTGEHTLEVKDFMDNETWCKGQLYVDGNTDLIIGVTKGRPIEVYNDSGAFR